MTILNENKDLYLDSVLGRMNDKTTGTETLLVEKKELQGIADYIDLIEEKLTQSRRELRIAEGDAEFYQMRLQRYEDNPICRLVMTIIDKAKALKAYFKNRQKIRYQFKLQVSEDE